MDKGPFEYGFEVRLHDTDAAGVVFYGHLFRHAHDAYESLMSATGHPLQDLIREGIGLPVLHAEAHYQVPMHQGEWIRVELRVTEIRQRSFSLEYRFLDAKGIARARARTVHVLTGAAGTRALPGSLARALTRWQQDQGVGPGGCTPANQ